MLHPVERRQSWTRLVGVERRAAPVGLLEGHPLSDPTRLEDEEFQEARQRLERERRSAEAHFDRWHGPGRSD